MKNIILISFYLFSAACLASPFEKFYPKIKGHEFTFGNTNSEIEIIAYFDLECPFSKRSFPHIEKLVNEYDGRVHFIFKHYPLDFHPHAKLAARYFEAMRIQDEKKAFQFMGEVFKNQKELKKGEKVLIKIAGSFKVDMAKLKKDVKSKSVVSLVDDDRLEAKASKISGTPTMFINGTSLSGSFPYKHVKNTIDGIIDN